MQKYDPPPETDAAGAPARGRPRAFDREAALHAAMLLFWEKGYEATSISELTAAMGIGAPSLYAAFGSKEALYAEALEHYGRCYDHYVWGRFGAATTAREAVRCYLMDSAAALTGGGEMPLGCMMTLSSVGSEGHEALGEKVRAGRQVAYERLFSRLQKGVEAGDVPAGTDIRALVQFVQTLQNGMSLMARNGATGAELTAVAEVAMAAWDARTKA